MPINPFADLSGIEAPDDTHFRFLTPQFLSSGKPALTLVAGLIRVFWVAGLDRCLLHGSSHFLWVVQREIHLLTKA